MTAQFLSRIYDWYEGESYEISRSVELSDKEVADMLGMTQGFSPRFLRRYANLNEVITDAVGNYVNDVKSGDFPNESESY